MGAARGTVVQDAVRPRLPLLPPGQLHRRLVGSPRGRQQLRPPPGPARLRLDVGQHAALQQEAGRPLLRRDPAAERLGHQLRDQLDEREQRAHLNLQVEQHGDRGHHQLHIQRRHGHRADREPARLLHGPRELLLQGSLPAHRIRPLRRLLGAGRRQQVELLPLGGAGMARGAGGLHEGHHLD